MTPTELAAVIEDHRLWLAGTGGKRAILRYADLANADLENANLRHAKLWRCNLRDANLRGAYLRDAYLGRCNLRDADLGRCYLRDADLRGADLGGANLRYSYLGRCNLRDAYLDGAYLRDASLRGADLDDARGLVWARSGPCGIGPRQILGWWTAEEGLVVEAGCFRGTPTELRQRVADGGWDWPAADRDRLAASVEKHLARVESDITEWLAACGGAA